jgi:hypothetical protein
MHLDWKMSVTSMKQNPYCELPRTAFWQPAVAQANPFDFGGVFTPKWKIGRETRIATAGSCFAQHVARALRSRSLNVLDVEPPTMGLHESDWIRFGYGTYSARYGNIYTAQQLLTIAKEAFCGFRPVEGAWKLGDRYVDAMRPSVEPDGLSSPYEVQVHRDFHLEKVKELFLTMDLLIFTLGLTEGWAHSNDGTVYPMCPGTIAGTFDPVRHEFRNYGFQDTLLAIGEFRRILLEHRQGRAFQLLLTVSPVPLTATASGLHVLQATSYSKAVLRAVAGELAKSESDVDYFPSFEIITNPAVRSMFYDHNLRSIRAEGVASVMSEFFRAYTDLDSSEEVVPRGVPASNPYARTETLQCEEYLLGLFDV